MPQYTFKLDDTVVIECENDEAALDMFEAITEGSGRYCLAATVENRIVKITFSKVGD